jgi:drug/metabolite transporter (DMT)-like permease
VLPYASLARLLSLALLWGSGFFWIKISLNGLTPTQLLFARLALGTATLIVVLRLRGDTLPHGRRIWAHLTLAALVANVVPYLLFGIAEQQVDSAVAGMLNATTPLWTILLAYATQQTHRLDILQILGLLLGLIGTFLIFSPWNLGTQLTSRGAILCLVAALSYAVSYLYMARYLLKTDSSFLSISASQLLMATALSTLILPLSDGLQVPRWRLDVAGSIVILGVLGTGVAYVLNYRIIAEDGPVAASLVVYLLPVVAVLLGVIVLREKLTPSAILGMLVVLAGVAVARRRPRGSNDATQPATDGTEAPQPTGRLPADR